MNGNTRSQGARVGIGAVLLMLGTLFLLEQFLDFQLGQWLWPLFIIVPGLFFFVGMILGGKPAGPLAIPGSIITAIGLLLFYQNTFNHFESWAYAWALIPAAAGCGLIINGIWSDVPARVAKGRRVLGIGLVLFLVGFSFFELVLNIGGLASGIVAPLFLIGAGIYLLLRRASSDPQPLAVSAPATAAPAEPLERVPSPGLVVAPAGAEVAPAEVVDSAPAGEQLSAREVAAHQ